MYPQDREQTKIYFLKKKIRSIFTIQPSINFFLFILNLNIVQNPFSVRTYAMVYYVLVCHPFIFIFVYCLLSKNNWLLLMLFSFFFSFEFFEKAINTIETNEH
jgi:hypothetical protein